MTELFGPGEMTARSGLSAKALRLYQRNGLLVPATIDPATGYRGYTAAQVERGQRISLLRRLEMPLAVIAQVVDAPEVERNLRIRRWWAEQEQASAAARQVVDRLEDFGATRAGWTTPVSTRDQPETVVASISRTVEQPDLVPTFTADVLRIRAHLAACGVVPAPGHWVLYHQVVATGVPGRIETCVPYRLGDEGAGAAEGDAGVGVIPPVVPAGPIALRVEPAARLVRTAVTVADCRYPTITGAFAAVIGGRDLAGPPREIYTGAWSEDQEEVVAEVAVPIRVDLAPGAREMVQEC